MPILLPDQNACFLHYPKTGGQWVTKVLQTQYREIPILHNRHASLKHSAVQDYITQHDPYLFTIIRHPAEWYRSYFAFFSLRGWRFQQHRLHRFACDDFQEFIDQVLEHEPGFLTKDFARYAGEKYETVDRVLRTEHLEQDLQTVFDDIDFDVDVKSLQIAPQNMTQNKPSYGYGQRKQIEATEAPLIETFYNGG